MRLRHGGMMKSPLLLSGTEQVPWKRNQDALSKSMSLLRHAKLTVERFVADSKGILDKSTDRCKMGELDSRFVRSRLRLVALDEGLDELLDGKYFQGCEMVAKRDPGYKSMDDQSNMIEESNGLQLPASLAIRSSLRYLSDPIGWLQSGSQGDKAKEAEMTMSHDSSELTGIDKGSENDHLSNNSAISTMKEQLRGVGSIEAALVPLVRSVVREILADLGSSWQPGFMSEVASIKVAETEAATTTTTTSTTSATTTTTRLELIPEARRAIGGSISTSLHRSVELERLGLNSSMADPQIDNSSAWSVAKEKPGDPVSDVRSDAVSQSGQSIREDETGLSEASELRASRMFASNVNSRRSPNSSNGTTNDGRLDSGHVGAEMMVSQQDTGAINVLGQGTGDLVSSLEADPHRSRSLQLGPQWSGRRELNRLEVLETASAVRKPPWAVGYDQKETKLVTRIRHGGACESSALKAVDETSQLNGTKSFKIDSSDDKSMLSNGRSTLEASRSSSGESESSDTKFATRLEPDNRLSEQTLPAELGRLQEPGDYHRGCRAESMGKVGAITGPNRIEPSAHVYGSGGDLRQTPTGSNTRRLDPTTEIQKEQEIFHCEFRAEKCNSEGLAIHLGNSLQVAPTPVDNSKDDVDCRIVGEKAWDRFHSTAGLQSKGVDKDYKPDVDGKVALLSDGGAHESSEYYGIGEGEQRELKLECELELELEFEREREDLLEGSRIPKSNEESGRDNPLVDKQLRPTDGSVKAELECTCRDTWEVGGAAEPPPSLDSQRHLDLQRLGAAGDDPNSLTFGEFPSETQAQGRCNMDVLPESLASNDGFLDIDDKRADDSSRRLGIQETIDGGATIGPNLLPIEAQPKSNESLASQESGGLTFDSQNDLRLKQHEDKLDQVKPALGSPVVASLDENNPIAPENQVDSKREQADWWTNPVANTSRDSVLALGRQDTNQTEGDQPELAKPQTEGTTNLEGQEGLGRDFKASKLAGDAIRQRLDGSSSTPLGTSDVKIDETSGLSDEAKKESNQPGGSITNGAANYESSRSWHESSISGKYREKEKSHF